MDLRDQLQTTLGTSYTLERELTGGGMARVFVATETALGRQVVVKVLSPELAQGVSVERFKREIQVAAQLQHPHIVPVHTSGQIDGLPFYTMPYVEGASLRSRLSRGGSLPIGETLSILREVAKALTYAHEHGVVHRDIKPDNVLITGGTAVVTDFGIAKALSASRTDQGATLTQIGVSIGTPAYMAPEQAAGDPDVDSRSDLYAFGCTAYEMLAGRPPFQAKTAQRLLAAHMGEQPQPIQELRTDTPPMLAELVMRCLEKDAEKRPQSASDLVRVLESITTSGGSHPAMPEILLGGRPRVSRALAVYAVAFVAVWILAKAAVVGVGLPYWTVPGALIVMGLGLPIILFTAFVHHGAHQAMTMAQVTPGGTPTTHGRMTRLAVKASPFVSWRRTTMGGVVALGVLAVLVTAYLVTRALGIGPAASLIGTGVLGQSDRVIIADFKSPSNDTTLGPVVTEAFRSDLAQSSNLVIVQPTTVREVLRRMQRSPDLAVDYTLAREIATREGVKAVIDGEVLALGGGYVIAAKLIGAQSGEVLASFRVTADEARDIIPAIGRLTRDVRTKVGESLRNINDAVELERVTTPSLIALKKYVQALQLFRASGDFDRGVSLLREAVAIDTGFAMAYRKLAIELGNRGGQEAEMIDAVSRAYAHRDRLSETERYLTEAAYWANGPTDDRQKELAAYETLLESQPNVGTALNNAALAYNSSGEYLKAEAYGKRAVATDSATSVYYANLVRALAGQGKLDSAEATNAIWQRHVPGSPTSVLWAARLLFLRGRFDSAWSTLQQARATETALTRKRLYELGLARFAATRGRVGESVKREHSGRAMGSEQGLRGDPLIGAADVAALISETIGDTRRATGILDSVLKAHPLEQLPAAERPYLFLASAYARSGKPDRARALLEQLDETERAAGLRRNAELRHAANGDIALIEQRFADAAREYRAGAPACAACAALQLAQLHDLAGNADSAIAYYVDYFTNVGGAGAGGGGVLPAFDARHFATSHRRLGELFEAKGEISKAAVHYMKFVELWKNADPALQPKVAEVRWRLSRLADIETRK